jgi:glycosyltransferase involved in cell wall biosynthesis
MISILYPTFNGVKYIRELVVSVLNQSFMNLLIKNWSLLIKKNAEMRK